MLSVPKWRFAIIGFLEALGVATGMAAAGRLFLKSSDGNFLHLLQDYVSSDWILCFSHASWTSYSDFESGVLLVYFSLGGVKLISVYVIALND